MSKYAEDEQFKRVLNQFIYFTTQELREEVNRLDVEISILKERQAEAKKELYSRNKELYELNYINLVESSPFYTQVRGFSQLSRVDTKGRLNLSEV
jgi:hypothetical protein